MELLFGFLANSLFFLLCSGTWYLVSSLARVFTILLMKALSFLFTTVLVCFPFTAEQGIRAGTVLDKAGATELETLKHGTGEILGSNVSREVDTGVEALIDISDKEASENPSSEVQTVQ